MWSMPRAYKTILIKKIYILDSVSLSGVWHLRPKSCLLMYQQYYFWFTIFKHQNMTLPMYALHNGHWNGFFFLSYTYEQSIFGQCLSIWNIYMLYTDEEVQSIGVMKYICITKLHNHWPLKYQGPPLIDPSLHEAPTFALILKMSNCGKSP